MRGDPLMTLAKCSCGLPFKTRSTATVTSRYCEHCDRPCRRQHIPRCEVVPCPLHRTANCPNPCEPNCKLAEHNCDLCRTARRVR